MIEPPGRGAIFLAVAIPLGADPVVAAAVAGLAGVGPALLPVDSAGLHVTLHFFGPLPAAGRARAALVLGPAAAAHHPFALTLHGLGAFPGWERPRVLWLGCGAGAGRLASVRATVQAGLARHGFTPDTRPFRPHCTVARVRGEAPPASWARLRAEAAGWPDRRARTVAVSALQLMQAVAQPQGPARYRTLLAAALCGPPPGPLPVPPG